MAKLENLKVCMKKPVAMLCMSVLVSVNAWSQKPQTGFGDLKQYKPRPGTTRVITPKPEKTYDYSSYDTHEYDVDEVWSRTSFVSLGYIQDQKLDIGGTRYGYTSKWGASAQVGNSYMWPKNAFFGMVKVAVDATWFDLTGVKYGNSYDDFYHLTAGMGVGASLHVAPLINAAESLQPLRIQGYCRFVPSYSLLLNKSRVTEDGDEDAESPANTKSEVNGRGAFLPIVSMGIGIDYRAVGIGYEYRFGNAKYDNLIKGTMKTEYDMTSSRIYISWRM